MVEKGGQIRTKSNSSTKQKQRPNLWNPRLCLIPNFFKSCFILYVICRQALISGMQQECYTQQPPHTNPFCFAAQNHIVKASDSRIDLKTSRDVSLGFMICIEWAPFVASSPICLPFSVSLHPPAIGGSREQITAWCTRRRRRPHIWKHTSTSNTRVRCLLYLKRFQTLWSTCRCASSLFGDLC